MMLDSAPKMGTFADWIGPIQTSRIPRAYRMRAANSRSSTMIQEFRIREAGSYGEKEGEEDQGGLNSRKMKAHFSMSKMQPTWIASMT